MTVLPPKVGLVPQVGVWTGQRGSDALLPLCRDFDGETIKVRQGETGKRMTIPVAVRLRTLLTKTPCQGKTIIIGAAGVKNVSIGDGRTEARLSARRKCHDAIAARGADTVIPPRRTAQPWKETTAGAAARNEARRTSRRFGRAIWRRWSGHHRRRRAETGMHCVKLLGQRVMARDDDRQSRNSMSGSPS